MKKIYFTTTTEGCATNLIENSTYRNAVQTSGAQVTKIVEEADVIVINTCAYNSSQEDRSIDIIQKYQKNFPQKEVIVGGCLTKINNKRLKEVYNGETFSPGNTTELFKAMPYLKIDNDKNHQANLFDKSDFSNLTWVHRFVIFMRPYFFKLEKLLGLKLTLLHNILETVIINEEYYGITVSQGCAGHCTFCAIKMAKGHVKSKPINSIFHEFQRGIDLGHEKFWLLGDDIGCYGIDINTNFSALLRKILSLKQDFKLVINYFEPYFFLQQFDEMLELLQDPRIININFPLQSANQRIVKLMGRDYDPQDVIAKLNILKKNCPNLVIKTNIITGFPSETNKEFLDSVRSVFRFDAILALDFTRRPGTRADKLDEHLPQLIKTARYQVIKVATILQHFRVLLKSFKVTRS